MTRPEITGNRDLQFSSWVREKLPDSKTGFMVTDLDFILYNYKTKKLMLVEVKTRRASMKKWQANIFSMLDKIIKLGTEKAEIKYYGFHCIRFEHTSFENGRCMFDEQVISELELIDILSMEALPRANREGSQRQRTT